MKIDRISYQKLFPLGVYINERIGVEMLVNEDEDPSKAIAEAKEFVERFHRDANPQLYKNGQESLINSFQNDIQIEKTPIEKRISTLVNDINSCKDKEDLESYKWLIKESSILEETYNKKMEEFK